MRKIYLLFCLTLMRFIVEAQSQISIANGTNLYISPSTTFTTDGLSLIPDAGFTINGTNISQGITVSHFTANNYVSQVYKFSANSNPFTGTIRFHYNDIDLNGLPEAALRVTINDGSSWLSYNTASSDATNNFVVSTSLSNRILNEIILSDAFAILPLKWGSVTAQRQEHKVNIEWNTRQENNVNHFDVERSENGQTWSAIIASIISRNSGADQKYSAVDIKYNAARLYYRVKQTDIDGKFTYSPVVTVSEVNESSSFLIYPNPAQQKFYIGNIGAEKIRTVHLYNNNGALVKAWPEQQTAYPVSDLPAGIYHLQVQLKNGSSNYFKLNKQ